MTGTDELVRTAPLAWRASASLCNTDVAAGHDCRWYHGPWQYFRALGLVTTAAVHEQWLRATLAGLLRDGNHRRVLVSGSTDYAMLAIVLDACADARTTADVTVVDMCGTPLFLCEECARARGATIRTRRANILDYTDEQPFDIVVTHAFLGYFDDTRRQALTRRWHALLRPGGAAVTVQRLRPGHPPGLARFSPAQAAAFRDDARIAAERHPKRIDITADALAAAAAQFAERFVSHPVRTPDELRALFVNAGFTPSVLEVHGNRAASAGGPSVPDQAGYAFLVATRD